MRRLFCLIKKLIFIIFLITILNFQLPIFNLAPKVQADELSEVEQKLAELKKALEMSRSATANLEVSFDRLQQQLAEIKRRIALIEDEIAKKEQEVAEGELVLADQQALLEKRVKTFYMRSRVTSPLLTLFSRKGLADLTRAFFYQQTVTDEDKKTITAIVLYIKDLEQKKQQLQQQRQRLAVVKEDTDKQAKFLEGEIAGAKAYQRQLSSEIAKLTARQQQLIAAKLASLHLPTSLGAGPLYCTDDRKIDPGFSPAFAFYTFGIPHRVGLNQYGALGRAQDGQSYQEILRAYYEGISFEKRDPKMKIKVQGYGEMELDQYLLGVYEMPSDWPKEALKAQAVAARSYALAYTGNGAREICTTQACQVYKGGNKGGNWEAAVKETEGEVMVRDGQVITAWYASTFGGYSFTSGDVWGKNKPWTKRVRDTRGDIASFADLFSKAYDKDSPCFYAAQGWRNEYGKSAWLKTEEVADIVNVILLARKDASTRVHLYQLDKPNPEGQDNWDRERVKQELRNRGVNPFEVIDSISVDWDKGSGQTTSVNVSGNAGSISFSGDEFKNFFNLRAPANIQIVGPLYNVERK